jgi:transcriptional regulatory protein LevR
MVNQLINQLVNKRVNERVNQVVNKLVNQLVNERVNKRVNKHTPYATRRYLTKPLHIPCIISEKVTRRETYEMIVMRNPNFNQRQTLIPELL